MEDNLMFNVFSKVGFHNSRLAVLGDEAKKVLDTMKGDGMAPEVLEEFCELARKAAGVVEITTVKDIEGIG